MKKLFTLLMTLWLAIGSLFAVNLKGGEVLYLTPNENWIKDNARFAIYLCNGSSGEKWVSMTKVTGETNLYSVTIPTGDYKNLIFVRLNPANATNNWSNKWNQTGDLSYDGTNNCCSINSGQWDCGMNVKWSFYSTEPVITVVTSPEFPATTIEETATATLKYTVDNSEEKATITIDNDAFTAVDNNGTVTITFAPTEAKEYTATITIAVGEVKETVEISATGLAKDVVKDPEVLNLTAPEFAEIIEGNTTTAVATYELLNADEAEAKVEGEGFEITEQEVGKVTIQFAPTKAGEYAGTLLVLVAGETLKEVAFTATAKPAPYYAIRGDMTDWSDKKDIKLTPNDDKSEYFIKGFEIASGKKFKVVYVNEDNATTWYGTDKVQLEAGISNSGQGNGDIALTPAGKYDIYYKVNEGKIWIQKYVAPEEPKPSLTVSAEEVIFDELTLGEEPVSATETIIYEIINSDEAAVITLESEVFSAEDVDGTITITFAPTAAGEYTAELTITLGEIVKTIAISGSAKDAEIIEPEKPELIVSTEEVEFETFIFDGEQVSSTETIKYEIKNSDEAAVIELESDVFKAEDENGTITITFTPIIMNTLYEAELTITLGDIVKTVAISAVVKPLIDDIILPEFDDTKVGEYDEIEVLYSLHKGNEGVARVEGDPAFEITSQEVGRMFIKFTPLEAREYTTTLFITSGKLEREITLIATGLAPDPEPTDITFTVQVPEGTKECYIAGTSDDKDLEWTFIQMEKVDGEENLFSITVEKTVLNGQEWKYASGAEWQYSEVIEGNGNRTEPEDPYDVVTAWQKLYDPDFQPIDPYYAIRGDMTGWTDYKNDIKLTEDADNDQWYIKEFEVDGTEAFKVVYVDENANVCDECWYSNIEESVSTDIYTGGNGNNIILVEGKYDIYFKPGSGAMWISKVIPDTPTDVEDAVAELIYAVDGTIIAPVPFAIFDLAGKDVTNANGSLQGTYIVKTLNSVTKVSVK